MLRQIRPRKKLRRSGRVRDPDYLAWVRMQRCVVARAGSVWCSGAIEADHVGRRPLGRKCDDREAIPLCAEHHRQRHARLYYFAGWTAPIMRAWCDLRIAATQRCYADGLQPGDIPW